MMCRLDSLGLKTMPMSSPSHSAPAPAPAAVAQQAEPVHHVVSQAPATKPLFHTQSRHAANVAPYVSLAVLAFACSFPSKGC